MTSNLWYPKQKPLLSLTSLSGGAAGLMIKKSAAGDCSGSGNSSEFDGSLTRLRTSSNSDMAMGTGTFTFECFFKLDQATSTFQHLFGTRTSNGNNSGAGWSIGLSNGLNIVLFSTSFHCQPSYTFEPLYWYHIACVREGTGTDQTKFYINGTLEDSGTCASDLTNDELGIGNLAGSGTGAPSGSEPVDGHISNVRITKGQTIYTSNFTPATSALTSTSQGASASNVKLICCQSNVNAAAVAHGSVTITNIESVSATGDGPFGCTLGTDGG